MEKINVLTVHYDTQNFIENIADLLKRENIYANFVIVDNSNNLDTSNLVETDNLKIKVVPQPNRQPHRAGLNLGINNIDFNLEYTLILDPDIVFTAGAVSKCLNFARKNDLAVIGVHKFYQYAKKNEDVPFPYVWFSLFKTQLLKDFRFKKIRPETLVTLAKRYLGLNLRSDAGDSVYDIARKNRFFAIEKFPKNEQSPQYEFKGLFTDDWTDSGIGITVSHYRGGSSDRNKQIHSDKSADAAQFFISKAKNFHFKKDSKLLKLNLGGGKKALTGTVNVDLLKEPTTDIVHDLNVFPYPFSADSACYCNMDNVLEHLNNPVAVLKELHRVMSDGGVLEIYVPYFKSDGAYQDPTHKHWFQENYFDYFNGRHGLHYEVGNLDFEIIQKKIYTRKTGVRHNWRLLLRKIVPFKNIMNLFLWNIYDTLYIKMRVKKSKNY